MGISYIEQKVGVKRKSLWFVINLNLRNEEIVYAKINWYLESNHIVYIKLINIYIYRKKGIS